ncbi:hypothetical protein NQ176_g6605 [Zarea fungicola]|uniref:Uncharacterized protein n=1 Tax=Zarea fungicola TaxID=93591 RepID=A0ACC1N2G9_9HYPO|nr:hypothetical protein NQ176_g6605 [Lecanicillium fungicola]
MSFGTIETVPAEVFENIVSYLGLGDEARLYSTCSRLNRYGDPILLGPFERNQRALLWALRRDDLALLHRCVKYGASLHVVTVSQSKGPEEGVNKDGESARPRVRVPKLMSTLALAARAKRLQVFNFLSSQGVEFGHLAPGPLRSQLRVLMKYLVSPKHLEKLERLIELGFISKVEEHSHADIAWPLARAIVAGASVELAQTFIEHGASLSTTHEHRYFGNLAPLAASIMTSTPDMSRLLTRHGAEYSPPETYFRRSKPVRQPIFAAVQKLAESNSSDTTMVELCLANGCCINKQESRTWARGFNWDWRPRQQLTTPLLEFLDAAPCINTTAQQKEATIANLAFLLEAGARTPAVTDLAGAIIQSTTPSCLELLLDKYHLEALNDDHFFTIVTMLVEAGCMDDAMGRLMRRYCRGARNQEPFFQPCWTGWKKLLDLFLVRPDADPSKLLMHLLVDSGTKELSTVERFLVSSVDYLIERGADINAPVSPLNSSPLHMLCSVYQHPRPDNMWWNRSPYQQSVVQHRQDLLHLMMSRGADPLLRFRGRNSPTELIQYLRGVDPSTRAWIRKVGKTLCEGMRAQKLAKMKFGGYDITQRATSS